MLLEKLCKEFEIVPTTFNMEESRIFDLHFEKVRVKKNSFLIHEGEIEKYSYFISEGIVRCWTLNHKGEEQTFWFCKDGTFSLSNISFTLQEKSTFNVQALIDSTVYRIDRKDVEKLYNVIPRLKPIFENFTAILLNRLLNRSIDLIKYSPEEYYLQMIKEYGVALNYIPLKDIATYIGVTPQALSRIRKRIF